MLERCVKGQTQNANESLHHVIWLRCPKEGFVGRNTVETAVALAVASFNDGAKSVDDLLRSMGLGEGDHTLQALVREVACITQLIRGLSFVSNKENVRDMRKRVERKS